MARSREVGIIKSCTLAAAFAISMALPAHADDKLNLSANIALTTDYRFRGISQTDEGPAVQGGFDATWKFFYVGVWASNLDWGSLPTNSGGSENYADIEMDWYGGIRPTWKGITFDLGVIYYSYPGACDDRCNVGEPDYVEFKAGASYTFNQKLTVGLTNYYSPDNTGETGNNDVLEFGAGYAFGWKIFNFFSPTISGVYGHQWGEEHDGGFDYDYWNVGLTLAFMDHWSADVRYWDTDDSIYPDSGIFASGPTVVGTIKATF
jgi:uncharacterized protein (TIGR02001 family)